MRKCQWLMISLMLVLLAGCGYQAQAKIQAVASFSIIADLVAQVGGDKVEVKSIIPFGVIRIIGKQHLVKQLVSPRLISCL